MDFRLHALKDHCRVDSIHMTTAKEELLQLVKDLQLTQTFPDEVMREVEFFQKNAGLDDPLLKDFKHLPFVTIDGATSKDLDQAIHVARTANGFQVAYAIADAAYYVKPKSALFNESMKRGASYYFPGFSVPMLPRELSEGIISLNADGPRRAVVFFHSLTDTGALIETHLVRALVQSQAKLSFGDVQKLVDDKNSSPLNGKPFEESLFLLREVGRLRMKLAAQKGLLRYRREEVETVLDGEGLSFSVMEVIRDEVELWNEQISLLCNAEGGRLLHEFPNPAVQPIYRTQGGPDAARLKSLANLTRALAKAKKLNEKWVWNDESETLGDYLKSLPDGPVTSVENRLSRAITRQAVMVNLRSEYTTVAGPHVGVGAEPYARFSAPMREMVGVFLHKEMTEMLTGIHPPVDEDEALRAEVVVAANRSRSMQRRVQDLANEVVINRLFENELTLSIDSRKRFTGTILGITASKVHVRLDNPPIDVKLYVRDLGKALGGKWLEVRDEGVSLAVKGTVAPWLMLGDSISMVVSSREEFEGKKRWVFALR
jgi:ribonuclease R